MGDKSRIEWTHATWNPTVGCTVVSPGCTNCYAMGQAARLLDGNPAAPHYEGTTRRVNGNAVWSGKVALATDDILLQPLKWKRPRLIFVNSMSDLFHESIPDEWIDKVLAVMALAPQHTFQVLTKRASRMRAYLSDHKRLYARVYSVIFDQLPSAAFRFDVNPAAENMNAWLASGILRNIWFGVSTEDQARADERIPDLLATPAAVRWVSAEPLLGPIDFGRIELVAQKPGSRRAGIHLDALRGKYVESGTPYAGEWDVTGPLPSKAAAVRLDWIVVGGESGRHARPMHPDWARSIRDQCATAGVPFFFKQWGEWGPGVPFSADISARRVYRGEIQTLQIAGSREIKLAIPTRDDDAHGEPLTLERYGKKIAGRQLDGCTHDAMPETHNA